MCAIMCDSSQNAPQLSIESPLRQILPLDKADDLRMGGVHFFTRHEIRSCQQKFAVPGCFSKDLSFSTEMQPQFLCTNAVNCDGW